MTREEIVTSVLSEDLAKRTLNRPDAPSVSEMARHILRALADEPASPADKLREARNLLGEVERSHPENSTASQACRAARVIIEVAWELEEREQ